MARPDEHWFEPLARHMGASYLRYSFTKGTKDEVDWLIDVLGLVEGSSVLDVGCGPGRHLHELSRRGCTVTGLDISAEFLALAASGADAGRSAVVRGDVSSLPFASRFDAVISLCQGGFGLLGAPGRRSVDPDSAVLREMARVLRPGGRVAVSAFSSYFQVRYLEDSDTFDADSGTNHEHTEVMNPDGVAMPAELWTTCYTPRELRLMASSAGLELESVSSVSPGAYTRATTPTVESPEFLLVASKGPSG